MYDASADFSIYERYSYLVQNQTLEAELGVGKIQAILADKRRRRYIGCRELYW